MNYEKKYKEALSRAATELETCGADKSLRNMIYAIFPDELAESEDEKIRNRILLSLEKDLMATKNSGCDTQDLEQCIAWLEKQGKETSWKPSKEEMDVLYGLAYITNQYDEHKEEVITRLYQDLKREFFNGSSYENMFPTNTSTEDDVRRRSTIQVLEYARSLDAYNQFGKADIDKTIAWLKKQGQTFTKKDVDDAYLKGIIDAKNELEKQGKQKPVLDFKASNWYVSKVDGKIHDMTYNSTDKVEPKFKVGDWITDGEAIFHVIDYIEHVYQLVTQSGTSFHFSDVNVENKYHLWTIADAKNGDVIFDKSDGTIGIFQSIGHHPNGGSFNDPSYCFLHCHYDDGFFYADFEDGNIMDSYDAIPATKEQRDLLFQEMEEAGYEWDAEKKELKKIHVIDDGKAEMDYCFTKMMAGKKASPTWSEEDDYNMQCMIAKVTFDIQKGNVGRNNELIDWLKSLKDRVQPNNLTVTDEELAQVKKDAYNDALNKIEYHSGEPTFDDGWSAAIWYLKKRNIQPQPKQEWSEDDEKMCQETIDWFEKKCFPYALESENPARESIKWLKSLKGRITWEPSKEQMHAFVQVYEWYNDNFAPSETLTSLYNDLKKL